MKKIYEKEHDIILHIIKDGFYEIVLKDCEKLKLQIQIDKCINASLFFTYDGENTNVISTISLDEDSEASLLFWNHMKKTLHVKQDIILKRNAKLHLGYGDITQSESSYLLDARLAEVGSDLHICSACKAMKKHFEMKIHHTCAHTKSLMENFAIVDEGGDYYMEASGIIQKGARDSESHQSSRVLTLSPNQKSEVIPILLIDENEVKASHATTLGQPDENQLYYLQSRGLSRNRALALLTIGYLMPITDVLKDESSKKLLQAEIEEKVINNV